MTENICGANSTCQNYDGGFNCTCDAGFEMIDGTCLGEFYHRPQTNFEARQYFQKRLSFCLRWLGGLCMMSLPCCLLGPIFLLGGSLSIGGLCSAEGVSVQGVSVPGPMFLPGWEGLYRAGGGLCPGDLCLGEGQLCPGESLYGDTPGIRKAGGTHPTVMLSCLRKHLL